MGAMRWLSKLGVECVVCVRRSNRSKGELPRRIAHTEYGLCHNRRRRQPGVERRRCARLRLLREVDFADAAFDFQVDGGGGFSGGGVGVLIVVLGEAVGEYAAQVAGHERDPYSLIDEIVGKLAR